MAAKKTKPSWKEWWLSKAVGGIFFLLFNGSFLFQWGLALAFLVFPPIYLAYRPAEYTPLVDTLFSIFLFLLAYWIGYKCEVRAATQQANDRWLPQAESVIFRLMTLHSNVCRFSNTTKTSCSTAECDLPELQTPEMRAVRIKMKADCGASGQRLDDIAHQLEDAIEDWRRFIAANCHGDECSRIFDALEQRQESLQASLLQNEHDRMGLG